MTALPPFPEGWFLVCYSHQLPAGRLFTKMFLGQEIVAFRDAEGRAAVLDATCPHLGAHMGKGGRVVQGTVECPFHKFRFDGHGACTFVPGAKPPKRARSRSWPVQEVNGFVLAYHDTQGRDPTWFVPEVDMDGWSELAHHAYDIKGHPQETTENGVDAAHLVTIHGYEDVRVVRPAEVQGPHLSSTLRMRRASRGPLRKLNLGFEVDFDVHVWGLGYSMVDIRTEQVGLRVRLWTFSTPRDGERIDLHIALRVQYLDRPERLLPGLQLVPKKLLRRGVLEMSLLAYKNDIEQDFLVWENKRFLAHPQLARNDGPIGLYRRYCRQFYPDLRAPLRVAE